MRFLLLLLKRRMKVFHFGPATISDHSRTFIQPRDHHRSLFSGDRTRSHHDGEGPEDEKHGIHEQMLQPLLANMISCMSSSPASVMFSAGNGDILERSKKVLGLEGFFSLSLCLVAFGVCEGIINRGGGYCCFGGCNGIAKKPLSVTGFLVTTSTGKCRLSIYLYLFLSFFLSRKMYMWTLLMSFSRY